MTESGLFKHPLKLEQMGTKESRLHRRNVPLIRVEQEPEIILGRTKLILGAGDRKFLEQFSEFLETRGLGWEYYSERAIFSAN